MRIVLFFASLLWVAGAHANSAVPGDDMDNFLAEKGLMERSAPAEQALVQKSSIGKASELVVAAMGSLGVPYRRGGNTFEGGFDCSGFVRAMYEQNAGLVLPRVAAQQAAATQKIDRTELLPGDLVFFNTLHRAFSHVGIYVGDHKFIHSPKPGAEVRIEDLRVNYWNRRFDGARRVLAQSTSSQDMPTAAPQSSDTPY
jgi:cell wall-associated NlpC family hydrolase